MTLSGQHVCTYELPGQNAGYVLSLVLYIIIKFDCFMELSGKYRKEKNVCLHLTLLALEILFYYTLEVYLKPNRRSTMELFCKNS